MAGRIWWTVAISAVVAFIIIIGIVAVGTFSTYRAVKSATGEIVTTLEETTNELSEVNSQLSSLNELNSHLSDIETGVNEARRAIDELSPKIDNLDAIDSKLGNVSTDLADLKEKYPPKQDVFIQGISKENLTVALNSVFDPQIQTVNNKVKSLSFNFYWTLFNSLFSLSILGVSIYLVFMFKKKKA